MSARIDHAAEAQRTAQRALEYEMANATAATPAESRAVIGAVANGYARAQVHATLALVEQQRTSNLIAYVAKWADDEVLEIDAQILEALGLS